MSSKTSGISFALKRLGRFLKVLMRNKRGIVGMTIIAFYAFLAIFASFVTPYDQLGFDPAQTNVALAGKEAVPSWLRTLPVALGGQPDLSENVIVVNDPNFSRPSWGSEWNWSVSSRDADFSDPVWVIEGNWSVSQYNGSVVTVRRDVEEGNITLSNFTGSGDGHIVISVDRAGSSPLKNVTIQFYREFLYPFVGPPETGEFEGFVFVDGTVHNETTRLYNRTSGKYILVPNPVYDIRARMRSFIEKVDGGRYDIWPDLSNKSQYVPLPFNNTKDNKTGLTTGEIMIVNSWNPASGLVPTVFLSENRGFFNALGRYRFGLELSLDDVYNVNGTALLEVHLDDVQLRLLGTSWGLLGTDYYGRDLFAQLVYGSRVSLYVGLISAALSVGIGLVIGLAAGYLGRTADELMMRVSDILIVLPGLPLLIVLFAVLGASIENLIILNGLLGWMGFAKMVRAQVLSIKERPFIEAAKAAGAGMSHILVRHILPNVMSLVYVTLATTVPGAIVSEAALSFLGLADPRRMSWGRMLSDMEAQHAVTKLNWVLPPGLSIAAICVSFILLGYALDEVLNPKLRMRR